MMGLLFVLAVADTGLPRPTSFIPPKTQSAKCTGVDEAGRPQAMTFVSRYLPDERRTALLVDKDSTGTFRAADWLENQNTIYKDGDRKHGIVSDWNNLFSKLVGNQYVTVEIDQRNMSAASISVISRVYSDRELTASRYSRLGKIVFAGLCQLFVENEPRSSENIPEMGPMS